MTRRGDNDADGGDGEDEDAFDAATPVAAAAAATAVSVPTARTMRGLPTELFQAGTKGWGLRAAVDVGAGSFVGEYVGEVLRWPEAKQRAASYDECAQRARAEPPPPSAVRGGGEGGKASGEASGGGGGGGCGGGGGGGGLDGGAREEERHMYMIVVREHCPGRGLSLRTVVDGTRFGNETVRFYCFAPSTHCAHYHHPPHNPSHAYITLPTKHRTVSLVPEKSWPQTCSLTRFGHFLRQYSGQHRDMISTYP
jgi:hypothetical protein